MLGKTFGCIRAFDLCRTLIAKHRRHCTNLFNTTRKFSSEGLPKKTDTDVENSTEFDESELYQTQGKSVKKMDEEDTPVERSTKRKMVSQNTMYHLLLTNSMPEDEEAVLEYYVRKAQEHMETLDDAEYYDVVEADKRLFFKMCDMWIQEAGETRRGHREFVQVAMNNLQRFNVQHEPNAYLKILECYPQSEHTGMLRNEWFKSAWQDKILDHELGARLMLIMSKNCAIINDEFYDVSMRLFGKFSRTTLAVRQLLFWQRRVVEFNPFPITKLEVETLTPVEIAVRGMRQANPGLDASYTRFKVESSDVDEEELKNSELNYIISVQTDKQREMLEQHDVSQPLFVEGPHMVYFQNSRVQYYVIRADPVEKKTEVSEHRILTDKEWWTKFYGKDFKTLKKFSNNQQLYSTESFLPTVRIEEMTLNDLKENEIIQVENDTSAIEGSVYAIAATDFKSIGALRSWVKGLETSNPILSQLTVVFNENVTFLAEGYKKGPEENELDLTVDL